MQKKTWIAVGAASALGLGVIAGGAVASANEMGLTSDDTRVPGLSNVDDRSGERGSADVTFGVTSDSIVTPSPATSASPITPVSPVSPVTPVTPASPVSVPSAVAPPAPAPAPAAPAPAPAPVDSAPSPASPASVPLAASAASSD